MMRREKVILGLILAVYAAMVLYFLRAFPVHPDEPGYTDPAASYHLGQGFTSGAWYAQSADDFWAGNVPLHQLALIGWYNLFGFSLESTRAINLFYLLASMLMLWGGLRTSGIIDSTVGRLLLISLFLCAQSIGMMPFWGRPDGITLFLLCAGFWVWTWKNPPLIRLVVLAVLSGLSVWAGLQLAVVLAFLGLALLSVNAQEQWQVTVALGLGSLIGASLLLLLYQSQGVLPDFLASVLPHASTAAAAGAINPWSNRLGALKDPSYLLSSMAFALCLAALFWSWVASRNKKALRPAVLLVAFSLMLPATLTSLSKFPSYYTFFSYIPATVVVVYCMDASRGLLSSGVRLAITCLLLGSALVGVPYAIAQAWRHDTKSHIAAFSTTIQGEVGKNDVILYERQAYYEVKKTARRCYLINWYYPIMNSSEKASLTLLLLSPQTFARTEDSLPGLWAQHGTAAAMPNCNFKAFSNSAWFRKNPLIQIQSYKHLQHQLK
jgi:hypothetical protein